MLIKIGPVTPEIMRVTNTTFWMRWQKLAYPTEYLSIGRRVYGDYKTDTDCVV